MLFAAGREALDKTLAVMASCAKSNCSETRKSLFSPIEDGRSLGDWPEAKTAPQARQQRSSMAWKRNSPENARANCALAAGCALRRRAEVGGEKRHELVR